MGGSDEVDPFPLCARISLSSSTPQTDPHFLLPFRPVRLLCLGCALLSEKDTFQGPEPVHRGRCGQVIVFLGKCKQT